jgi:hypothetical protein
MFKKFKYSERQTVGITLVMLESACHQLLGFLCATRGYSLEKLLDEMNLTREEWNEMKDVIEVDWIPSDAMRGIERYFDNQNEDSNSKG